MSTPATNEQITYSVKEHLCNDNWGVLYIHVNIGYLVSDDKL